MITLLLIPHTIPIFPVKLQIEIFQIGTSVGAKYVDELFACVTTLLAEVRGIEPEIASFQAGGVGGVVVDVTG